MLGNNTSNTVSKLAENSATPLVSHFHLLFVFIKSWGNFFFLGIEFHNMDECFMRT